MALPPVLLIVATLVSSPDPGKSPEITFWYGSHQVFGRQGVPQRWVNVLGNVHDPDGIASLSFSLNGGPDRPLTIGPDRYRLWQAGDFNVEIDYAELVSGPNQVVLTAVDAEENRATRAMTVEYVAGNTWDRPYVIDWSAVDNVADAVQVLDGLWIHDEAGLRTAPTHVGYDRTVAIGDVGWADYEVTVSVTIHAIDETAFDIPESKSPGVGIYLRWQGHTDDPLACPQPHCGWVPNGASNWYEWQRDEPDQLQLFAGPTSLPAPRSACTNEIRFEPGHTYWFKARVETTPVGSLYSLKVWEDGAETEPADWELQRLTTTANLARGSLLLIAHHVDATFGNLAVMPIPRKRFDLLRRFSGYISRSPLLFVAAIGLGVAYGGRRRAPRKVIVAMGLLLVAALVGAWLPLHLPELLQQRGWNVRNITVAAVAGEFAVSAAIAIGWGLALYALLSRQEQRES